MVVGNERVVGGRSGEAAKVGDVARSHGCHGEFQQVDRGFLCTLYVIM